MQLTYCFLEIVRHETSMFRDAGEHARADFFAVVESEGVVRPAGSSERAMRAFLPFDAPADCEQCLQNSRSLSGSPFHSRIVEKQEQRKNPALRCRR